MPYVCVFLQKANLLYPFVPKLEVKDRFFFFLMYGVLSCRNTCPFLQKKAELITHHSSRMNFQFCTSVRRYASSTDDNTPLPAICYEKQDASWTIHVTQHWMHQTRMTKKKAWVIFRQRTVTFLSGRKIDWLKFNRNMTWSFIMGFFFFKWAGWLYTKTSCFLSSILSPSCLKSCAVTRLFVVKRTASWTWSHLPWMRHWFLIEHHTLSYLVAILSS